MILLNILFNPFQYNGIVLPSDIHKKGFESHKNSHLLNYLSNISIIGQVMHYIMYMKGESPFMYHKHRKYKIEKRGYRIM